MWVDVGHRVRGITSLGRSSCCELLPSVRGLEPGVRRAEVWNRLEAGVYNVRRESRGTGSQTFMEKKGIVK